MRCTSPSSDVFCYAYPGRSLILINSWGRASPRGTGLWPMQELNIASNPGGRLGHYLLGFGQDADGEVYVLTTSLAGPGGTTGRVYRLAAADAG